MNLKQALQELGQPFKVPQQYQNFIGKEVEVLGKDGKKVKGILKSVDGNDFVVAVNEKVQVEGKKRPVKMDVDHAYKMDEVKYTKYIISFSKAMAARKNRRRTSEYDRDFQGV